MADIWEKTSIPNKLNHKLQAHARMYEENQEKNDRLLKYFAVKGSPLEACRRAVMLLIAMIFATWILHSINTMISK